MEKGKNKQKLHCQLSHRKAVTIETGKQNHHNGTSQRHMGQLQKMSRHSQQLVQLPQRGTKAKMKKMTGQLSHRTKTVHASVEREKLQKEKKQQIKAYKKKRLQKAKAINKKTRYGQPVMKDRIQLLLNQIQEMKKN